MAAHQYRPIAGQAADLFPLVLSKRQQSQVIHQVLERRLETILPIAMREAGLDMWIVLCQEDDLDPAFKTLIPMDTWTPALAERLRPWQTPVTARPDCRDCPLRYLCGGGCKQQHPAGAGRRGRGNQRSFPPGNCPQPAAPEHSPARRCGGRGRRNCSLA